MFDKEKIWRCRCENLSFNSYEERHAHKCPQTREEKLVDIVKELALIDPLYYDNNGDHGVYEYVCIFCDQRIREGAKKSFKHVESCAWVRSTNLDK